MSESKRRRSNFNEYVEVISGFTRTVGTEAGASGSLSGPEIVSLMRKHRVTIEALAFRLGTTRKRVRKIRQAGLSDALGVRDWLQAITGEDPGPIPKPYRISSLADPSECGFCGCPVFVGDQAFEYVGEVFCSTTCCRKSRGW